MRVLVVGNRRTVSEVGEVLEYCGPDARCSSVVESVGLGPAVLGGRVASCMGKYGALIRVGRCRGSR